MLERLNADNESAVDLVLAPTLFAIVIYKAEIVHLGKNLLRPFSTQGNQSYSFPVWLKRSQS